MVLRPGDFVVVIVGPVPPRPVLGVVVMACRVAIQRGTRWFSINSKDSCVRSRPRRSSENVPTGDLRRSSSRSIPSASAKRSAFSKSQGVKSRASSAQISRTRINLSRPSCLTVWCPCNSRTAANVNSVPRESVERVSDLVAVKVQLGIDPSTSRLH